MARGSHHGGGFHSGGFHSSGGYHGSGGHYSGGSSGGGSGGGGSPEEFFAMIFLRGITFVIVFLFWGFSENGLPGYNIWNVLIFVASFVVLAFAMKDSYRYEALKYAKNNCMLKDSSIWKKYNYMEPSGTVSDNRTWASVKGNYYNIAFYDKEFGEENFKKVRETMNRTPKILWVEKSFFIAPVIISFLITVIYYEAVIPFFENAVMTDEAFAFIDAATFYFTSVFALVTAIACHVVFGIRDRILHECALRIIEDNVASVKREETEEFIKEKTISKWYHTYCPNCGAKASSALKTCPFCGTSLEVTSFDGASAGSFRRIKETAESDS